MRNIVHTYCFRAVGRSENLGCVGGGSKFEIRLPDLSKSGGAVPPPPLLRQPFYAVGCPIASHAVLRL